VCPDKAVEHKSGEGDNRAIAIIMIAATGNLGLCHVSTNGDCLTNASPVFTEKAVDFPSLPEFPLPQRPLWTAPAF
jgi:hypothetical protein